MHLGTHDHLVAEVILEKFSIQVKSLVNEEVFRTSEVIVLTIALTTSKTFISEHLLNEDGEGIVEILKGDKLRQMMDKFIMLFSPNI
jgi:hypothetical protein